MCIDDTNPPAAPAAPPVDWRAEARIWRDAYLALVEHAMDCAVELERQRQGRAL